MNILFLVLASAATKEVPLPVVDNTVYITLDPVHIEAPKQPKAQSTPPSKAKPTPSPKPTPVATPAPVATPPPVARQTPRPIAAPVPVRPRPHAAPVQDAHNRVMAAKSNDSPKKDDFVVASGGNARAGQIMARQGAGGGTVNTATPVPPPVKEAEPTPEPKAVATAAPAPPMPRSTPAPEPTPAPKPVGPTREAEPAKQEMPTIPDNLKDGDFKSFVRVKVEVAEDGSFSVVLRTSSGNQEVDSRVLDALKRWKWKPALKNGEAVPSTQLFKFEFEVN